MAKRIMSEAEKYAKILEANVLNSIKKQIRKENAEHLKRRAKTFKANYQMLLKLKSIGLIDAKQGFTDDEYMIRYGHSLEVTVTQFPLLRTVFPMVKATENKEVMSAEDGIVRVFLQLDKNNSWPISGEIRVYYLVVLDADSKCKIVTQKSESTYSSLVCSR
jgi:hypothetical protein